MHPQDFALVAFRVLAVYIGIFSVPGIIQLGSLPFDSIDSANAIALLGSAMFLLLVPVAIAILLWVLAPRLAVIGTRERRGTETATSLSARDLTRTGLVIVGIASLVRTIPQSATQILMLFDERASSYSFQSGFLVSSILSVVIAMVVVLGADRIAAFAHAARYSGRSK